MGEEVGLGVLVGVGVVVGVREGGRVGPVGVGKGPIRASEVRAMEVRVPFALAISSRKETDGCSKPRL